MRVPKVSDETLDNVGDLQRGRSAAQRGDLSPDRIIEQKEETHASDADRRGMPDGASTP